MSTSEIESRVHAAVPDCEQTESDAHGHCGVCGQRVHAVPGGNGRVFVHSDTGTVAAPNPPSPPRFMLVYQNGIANLFAVDSFNLSAFGRNARRVFQGAFRDAIMMAQGAAQAGAVVRTASCNTCGDCANVAWVEGIDGTPFRDQAALLHLNGGAMRVAAHAEPGFCGVAYFDDLVVTVTHMLPRRRAVSGGMGRLEDLQRYEVSVESNTAAPTGVVITDADGDIMWEWVL